MPQFSSSEAVSLEKEINLTEKPVKTEAEHLDDVYEVTKCAEWIRLNGFQKVCLQFPDYMLPDSSEVALKLQGVLGRTLYILGDTAYESCCIDYIAAAHVKADAIIHFGPTCFSKTSADIPYLNIYEKLQLNVENLAISYGESFGDVETAVNIVVDSGYMHKLDDIKNAFISYNNVRVFTTDEDLGSFEDQIVLFIGNADRKLQNIYLSFQFKSVYFYDPRADTLSILKFELDSRVLKKRYFLVEKIKDSTTIGIVIGTLGVKNYLKVIERLKKLINSRGKKYYLISVGKPTVAKLANFADIDIYVMITCSMNEIYENRDFYRPVVTPYDVELALNPSTNGIKFSYDYNSYLKEDAEFTKVEEQETDVSLLTGKVRSIVVPEDLPVGSGTEIALKLDGTVALNSNFGAGFLAQRSWKGLEQNLGQTDVKLAEKGRKGTAQSYENENV